MKRLIETEKILDTIEDGIIILNTDFKFDYLNKVAKNILAIEFNNTVKTHKSGKLEKGDIVIVADNMLGYDDGNLNIKDLELINIKDDDLSKDDIFIAIGVYENSKIKPVYKYWRNSEIDLSYSLETEFLRHKIFVEIDEVKKIMTINVNEDTFQMDYLFSVGHMVVISQKTDEIKFFQQNGYSYRNETIAELLHGNSFFEKKLDMNNYDVLGESILESEEYLELLKIINMAITTNSNVYERLTEIRKRLLICSVSLVKEEGIVKGFLLKIKKVSDLHDMLKLRNNILDLLLKYEKNIRTNIRDRNANLVEGISGNSIQINKVKYLAYKASQIKSTVLITGESGTGKTLLAREIHKLSGDKKPFVHVNCSSIPYTLFESELFGYEKGSFTGASNSGKIGYFELANNGTIFLDEIGELPNEIQTKLLQVLQEKAFFKIGSNRETNVNLRIIAATNVDLSQAVKENKFRRDLYYRLNVFPIYIPPLRERKKDLYFLIQNLIKNIAIELGCEEKTLSGEAFEKLMDYDWPGNVRELENVLERAIIISETNVVNGEHLNIFSDDAKIALKDIIAAAEKKAILETLDACNYNKKITMRKLGISKSAFYEKINKYEIDI